MAGPCARPADRPHRTPARRGFTRLLGGSTLPQWRGRGLYRALVAGRAQRGAARSVKYLQVEACERVLSFCAERARKAVTMRIRAVITTIAAQDDALARHLRTTIHTGRLCKYQPEEAVSWRI